jgi:hypothetical protein
MATGQIFIAELARVTGFSTAVLQKLLGELRMKRMIPSLRMSVGTGNEHLLHLNNEHAALVLLALGCGMSTAAEDVRRLCELEWSDPQAGDFGSLFHVLAAMIGIRAHRIYNGQEPTGQFDAPDTRLVISMNPLQVFMHWTAGGLERRRDFAVPQSSPAPCRGVRRVTIIDSIVLNTVARLCADSWAHTLPQRETAATPAREAAALTGNFDGKTKPSKPSPAGRCNSPGAVDTGKSDRGQGRSVQRSRKPTPRTRHLHEDRIATIAAMAGD